MMVVVVAAVAVAVIVAAVTVVVLIHEINIKTIITVIMIHDLYTTTSDKNLTAQNSILQPSMHMTSALAHEIN